MLVIKWRSLQWY